MSSCWPSSGMVSLASSVSACTVRLKVAAAAAAPMALAPALWGSTSWGSWRASASLGMNTGAGAPKPTTAWGLRSGGFSTSRTV